MHIIVKGLQLVSRFKYFPSTCQLTFTVLRTNLITRNSAICHRKGAAKTYKKSLFQQDQQKIIQYELTRLKLRFLETFRLNKVAFQYVLNVVEEVIGPSFNTGVTALYHLVCTLRFLAQGGFQHGVGNDFNIGLAQPTVSKTLKRCLAILEDKLCAHWIKLDMTSEEKRVAKEDYFNRTKFPGVIMCVDGTHVKIIPRTENKPLYYNDRGYYSINAMLMCDSKRRIRYIAASNPGSHLDSHVWNLSDAKKYFENKYREGERDTWILGDSDYPLQPWLMTPFRLPEEGSRESVYNKMHTDARSILDETITILKNRFLCIGGARQLHYSPQKAAQIITVCCALHNICIHYKIEEPNVVNKIEEEVITEIEHIELDEAENNDNEAIQIRQSIVDSL